MTDMQERAVIVAFLRRETRLYLVADLLEAGAHHFTPKDLAKWCDAQSKQQREGEPGHVLVLSMKDDD